MSRIQYSPAFTIIELLVAAVVISILAGIITLSYGSWQHRNAESVVKSDLIQATNTLKSYKNFQNTYPPNLSDTGFAASSDVALFLRTNSPQTPKYQNLSPDQNAQLFLNSCNANIVAPNTSCTFSGNNVHVKGTSGSNTVWQSPVMQNDVVLQCGSVCDAAAAAMIQQFIDQNGTFPIIAPKNQTQLPAPTLTSFGGASRYCMQATSGKFSDIIYHTKSENASVTAGVCPQDPALHYP